MGAITIRLPDDLHEMIRELAEAERRSINNQIVMMLEHTPDIRLLKQRARHNTEGES